MAANRDATSDAISKVLDDLYRPQVSFANAAEALNFLASAHLDDGDRIDWNLNYSLFHYSEVMDRAAADLAEIRRNLAEGHDLSLLEERGQGPGKVQVLPARQLSASKRDAWGKAVSTTREARDPVLIEHHAQEALHYVSGDAIYAVDTHIYRAQQALNRIADQAPPSASLIAALHALPRVLRPSHDDSTPIYSTGTFETMGTCVNTFMDLHTDHPELRWSAEDMQGPQREPIPPPSWQVRSAARQAPPTVRRSATSPPTPVRRHRRVAGQNRPTTT